MKTTIKPISFSQMMQGVAKDDLTPIEVDDAKSTVTKEDTEKQNAENKKRIKELQQKAFDIYTNRIDPFWWCDAPSKESVMDDFNDKETVRYCLEEYSKYIEMDECCGGAFVDFVEVLKELERRL